MDGMNCTNGMNRLGAVKRACGCEISGFMPLIGSMAMQEKTHLPHPIPKVLALPHR
jgi:hypothetical protein